MTDLSELKKGMALMVIMQVSLGAMGSTSKSADQQKAALEKIVGEVVDTLSNFEGRVRADERKRLLSEQGAAMDELGKIGGRDA